MSAKNRNYRQETPAVNEATLDPIRPRCVRRLMATAAFFPLPLDGLP